MALNLETVTEYWRKSGGEYDQRAEKAIIGIPELQSFVASIAGHTLIDSEHGDLIVSMHNNLKAATSDRAELLEALKSVLGRLQWIDDPRTGSTEKPWIKMCEKLIKKLEQQS